MANEWTKVELYGSKNDGNPRRYTCASGVAISKGDLLLLSDPRTVASHSTGVGGYMGGVAAMDKSATDLSTSISAWTTGVFEVTASGTITTGHPVKASTGENIVEAAAESIMGSAILGYALETSSDGETINVRLAL